MRPPLSSVLALAAALTPQSLPSASAGTVRAGNRTAEIPEQPRAAVQATPEPAAPLTRQQRRLQEQRARRSRG